VRGSREAGCGTAEGFERDETQRERKRAPVSALFTIFDPIICAEQRRRAPHSGAGLP